MGDDGEQKSKRETEKSATAPKPSEANTLNATDSSKPSSTRKLQKPPTVLSRYMQKKNDYLENQQGFHRSSAHANSGQRLRNGVLEKIGELDGEANKKLLEQSGETKAIDDTEDECLRVKKSPEGSKQENGDLERNYRESLRTLPTDGSTQEQIAALDLSESMGPSRAGRVTTTSHGHRHGKLHMTNGFTTQDQFLPGADVRKEYESHKRLSDLSGGEITYMAALHLAWDDPKHDEFLSYSNDCLFLLVHALGRHHTGQGGVTIQFINCDEATTLDGQPVAFYRALDIYNIF